MWRRLSPDALIVLFQTGGQVCGPAARLMSGLGQPTVVLVLLVCPDAVVLFVAASCCHTGCLAGNRECLQLKTRCGDCCCLVLFACSIAAGSTSRQASLATEFCQRESRFTAACAVQNKQVSRSGGAENKSRELRVGFRSLNLCGAVWQVKFGFGLQLFIAHVACSLLTPGWR